MPEPENLVLQLLRDMRGDLDAKFGRMDAKIDALGVELRSEMRELAAELRSEMKSLRADVAADLLTTRKELNEQIVGLRRAVVEYHSVVVGHGIIISDLEARVRRIEQRLELPPLEQR